MQYYGGVVEEESTHDQRHNFCLIARIILRVVV